MQFDEEKCRWEVCAAKSSKKGDATGKKSQYEITMQRGIISMHRLKNQQRKMPLRGAVRLYKDATEIPHGHSTVFYTHCTQK